MNPSGIYYWESPLVAGTGHLDVLNSLADSAELHIKEYMARMALLMSTPVGLDPEDLSPVNIMDDDLIKNDPTIQDTFGSTPLRFRQGIKTENRVPITFVERFVNTQNKQGISSQLNPDYESEGLIQFSQRYNSDNHCQFRVDRKIQEAEGGSKICLSIEMTQFDPSWFDWEFVVQKPGTTR